MKFWETVKCIAPLGQGCCIFGKKDNSKQGIRKGIPCSNGDTEKMP